MFRVYQTLPFGVLKIPFPQNICFEDGGATGAVVDLAVKAGEAAADIDNLEEKAEELEEKTESLEQQVKWNDQALDRTFERIWAMESRIESLEAEIIVLKTMKEEPEEEEEEEEEQEEEPPETIIEPAEGHAQPKEKKKHTWSLW